MNINLNFGGALGAMAGVIVAGVAMAPSMTPGSQGPFGKILIGSALAGAYAGNALWSRVFDRKAVPQPEAEQAADNQDTHQTRRAA